MVFFYGRKRPLEVIFAAAVFVFLTTGCAEARQKEGKARWVRSKTGLSSLMSLSKDRGAMVRELNDETKNYDNVVSALNDGVLKEGQKAQDIIKKYGEPVVRLPYRNGELTRWVYKPYQETFFQGAKVSLFFDTRGDLVRWRKREEESSGI